MMPVLRIFPFAAVIAALCAALSCHSGTDDTSACGTPNASSVCESVTWPRVAIGFGDPSAAGFSYLFHIDDGPVFSLRPHECPGGYGESPALHCDIGIYGAPAQPPQKVATVQIVSSEGGAVLFSRDVQLTPFNYCGNGIAQIIAATGDAGLPELSDVQYLNACGSL